MSDIEEQGTNHKQPARKSSKRATAAETTDEITGSAAEVATAAADAVSRTADSATDVPDGGDAAANTRSAMDGISQAAGEAAQRAGVAAQRATGVLTDVATDVASTVSAHAPAVADASRTTARIAAREVRSASSENLMLGSVFSSGVALGLMLARAPRILVLLALVPVVVFGANLVSRRTGRGPSTAAKPAPKSTKVS